MVNMLLTPYGGYNIRENNYINT